MKKKIFGIALCWAIVGLGMGAYALDAKAASCSAYSGNGCPLCASAVEGSNEYGIQWCFYTCDGRGTCPTF